MWNRRMQNGDGGKINQYVVGSKIFIGCLVFLAVIYVIDILLGIENNTAALYTKDILEIIKTLLFTICGYLFGRTKTNQENNES